MKMFFLGVYVTGALATFVVVGFFTVLGGNDSSLWKPFAYAAAWPVMLPMFLCGRA